MIVRVVGWVDGSVQFWAGILGGGDGRRVDWFCFDILASVLQVL